MLKGNTVTYFLQHGSKFRTTNEANIQIKNELAPGTYSVMLSDEGFYLEKIYNFEFKSKIYGDVNRKADRIMTTFNDRTTNTGILLEGEKGSGKTLLAKILSERMLKEGVPTLVINLPFTGEAFNNFLNSIEQPTIVIFDEFEKVYSKEDDQKALLTLFDGTSRSKKLYLVTCNEAHRVTSYMKNRPGRFFYKMSYRGLQPDFIREYCEDNLKDKKEIERIVNFSIVFGSFNFDMLKAIVEDMNRYNEPLGEVLKYLNISPDSGNFFYEAVELRLADNVSHYNLQKSLGALNLYTNTVLIRYNSKEITKEDIRDETDKYWDSYKETTFSAKDIIKVDGLRVILKNDEGHTVCIQRKIPKENSYLDLLLAA